MADTVMMYAEPLANKIRQEIQLEISRMKSRTGSVPKLVALLIGNDPVSRTYVELKRNDCKDVGIISEVIDVSSLSTNEIRPKLLEIMHKLNLDPSVSAVIPQMPFDGKISEEEVFSTLDPDKDVDGMTPYRLGKLFRKEYSLESSLLPCTPKGVLLLIRHYKIDVKGADVAIIGRSILV